MSAPQTTVSDRTETNGAWPADVVAFAAASQVTDFLNPLREAIHRISPTARFVKVSVEEDPELRDNTQIVFDVQVVGLSLDEAKTARRQWHDALLSICPRPRIFTFCLRLSLKS